MDLLLTTNPVNFAKSEASPQLRPMIAVAIPRASQHLWDFFPILVRMWVTYWEEDGRTFLTRRPSDGSS
jgi:hypothetical protein